MFLKRNVLVIYYRFKEKTMMKRQCVGQTLFFFLEATPLQHNLTYLNLLVLV